MKKNLVIISLFFTLSAYGQTEKIVVPQKGTHVPAYPGVIERLQPDGDTLHIYLRGDEKKHYSMTLDGWLVMEDSGGTLRYAVQKKGGVPVAGRKQAHDEEQRKRCEMRWLQRKGILKQVVLY